MYKRLVELPLNYSFFLFGARGTGKTSIIKQEFETNSSYYYDLLKSEVFLRLEANPELLRQDVQSRPENIKYIIIDEIQFLPIILNEVHYLIESENPPIFILTGSSARKLKRSFANMLAGRAVERHLHPLSFFELGNDFNLIKNLQFGSLPGVVNIKEESLKKDILSSYVSTYLKEEIKQESQIRKLNAFNNFLQLAAEENGMLVNYSELARGASISNQTSIAYYEILIDTLLGFYLPAFNRKVTNRLKKSPKFYFFDLGVLRAIQNKLGAEIRPKTKEFGNVFEHFFILEVNRLVQYASEKAKLSYYRTESGAEVDLVIEFASGRMIAIEIKATNKVKISKLSGLKSFARNFPNAEFFCASLEEYQRDVSNIKIINWKLALIEIVNELKVKY